MDEPKKRNILKYSTQKWKLKEKRKKKHGFCSNWMFGRQCFCKIQTWKCSIRLNKFEVENKKTEHHKAHQPHQIKVNYKQAYDENPTWPWMSIVSRAEEKTNLSIFQRSQDFNFIFFKFYSFPLFLPLIESFQYQKSVIWLKDSKICVNSDMFTFDNFIFSFFFFFFHFSMHSAIRCRFCYCHLVYDG